jgi:hypothetical protein
MQNGTCIMIIISKTRNYFNKTTELYLSKANASGTPLLDGKNISD